MLLSEYIAQVRYLVHDLAGNDYTDGELTDYINEARTRVAMDTWCTRLFETGLNAIAGQEQYPMTACVPAVTVTAGGTGYSLAPTVIFTGGGGTGAAATAVLTAGVVTSIYMTDWGEDYTSAPAVTFSSGAAAATATVLTEVMDINSISVLWNSLRYTFSYLPFLGFQTYCRANPTMQTAPGVWSNIPETKTVFVSPIPDSSNTYLMEWDLVVLPDPLVSASDSDLQVPAPYSDGVQWWAAHKALVKLQNFAQAEYMASKYEKRVRQINMTKQGVRVTNSYRAYASRASRL